MWLGVGMQFPGVALSQQSVTSGGGGGSAYPEWAGYDTLTPDAPAASVTDWTYLIDLSLLSVTWWANVASDGKDIRATKSDGTTELAVDVIAIDTVGKTGLIAVKYSGVQGTTADAIRIYAGNALATMPAATATYGQYNAYDDYTLAYWPMEANFTDRTRYQHSGTSAGSPTAGGVTGQLRKGTDFNGTSQHVAFTPKAFGRSWEVPGGFTNTGLTYDSDAGTLWIGDFTNSKVVEVTLDGIATGTEIALGFQPQGVAFDTSDNTLWVADYTGQRIKHYSRTGTDLGGFATTGFNPNGVCYIASADFVCYVRNAAGVIARHNASTGALDSTITLASTGPNVDGLEYDAANNQYLVSVDSTGNCCTIVRVSNVGATVATYYIASSAEDIALVSGEIYYCSDAEFHDSIVDGNRVYRIGNGTVAQDRTLIVSANIGTLTPSDAVVGIGNPITGIGYGLYLTSTTNARMFVRDGTTSQSEDSAITLSAWDVYAMVLKRSTTHLQFYYNGAKVGADRAISGSITGQLEDIAVSLGIANLPSGDINRWLDAAMDEFSWHATARDATWLAYDAAQREQSTFWVDAGWSAT